MESEYSQLVERLRDFKMCPNARADVLERLMVLNNQVRSAMALPPPPHHRMINRMHGQYPIHRSKPILDSYPNRSKKGVLIRKSSTSDGSGRSPTVHTSVVQLGDQADLDRYPGDWHRARSDDFLVQKLIKIARLWDQIKGNA
jgi:hypothetical protein